MVDKLVLFFLDYLFFNTVHSYTHTHVRVYIYDFKIFIYIENISKSNVKKITYLSGPGHFNRIRGNKIVEEINVDLKTVCMNIIVVGEVLLIDFRVRIFLKLICKLLYHIKIIQG